MDGMSIAVLATNGVAIAAIVGVGFRMGRAFGRVEGKVDGLGTRVDQLESRVNGLVTNPGARSRRKGKDG